MCVCVCACVCACVCVCVCILSAVFAAPVPEMPTEERVKLSKQRPLVAEEPMMGAEPLVGADSQLTPIVGEYESLQRLAEREELPERRTAVSNHMREEEPIWEEGPRMGEEPMQNEFQGLGRINDHFVHYLMLYIWFCLWAYILFLKLQLLFQE